MIPKFPFQTVRKYFHVCRVVLSVLGAPFWCAAVRRAPCAGRAPRAVRRRGAGLGP